MSHHLQLRSSVLPLRFSTAGLAARFSRNEAKHPVSSGGSVGVAVASPSRTLQRHRADATAKEVGVQETAQGSAALGWAARDASGVLSPFDFSRRCVSSNTVLCMCMPLFAFMVCTSAEFML
jgi:cinnamyl-alcohol dehydrogenase